MGTSHPLSVTTNNHAITGAAAYADIAARDADTAFHSVASNVNKVVRVESPLSFFLLADNAPTWTELTNTGNDTFIEHADTPASYAGAALEGVRVNAGGTALEFLGSVAGDVVGPASATDNALVRFDLTTGKIIQNSVGVLTDAGALSGITSLDLDSGGDLQINSVSVLNATTLGSSVVASSLTSVGTIATGVWQGTPVTELFGGTNQTSYLTGDILFASAANTLAKLAIGSTDQVLSVAAGIPAWRNAPAIFGDVVGPVSATDNALARFDLTTGKIIQNSLALLTDAGVLSGITWEGVSVKEGFGGTAQTTYDTGNILFASATDTLAKLAIGSTDQVLSVAAGVPAYRDAPATFGDVVGPALATDNALARFDAATGKLLQNSLVLLSDIGVMDGITQLNIQNLRLTANTLSSQNVNGSVTLNPNGTGDVNVSTSLIINVVDPVSAQDAATKAYVDLFDLTAVVGPASATDNAIARFDLTTGKLIQNGLVTITDTGQVKGVLDPTDSQDAATKAYVDLEFISNILVVRVLSDLPTPSAGAIDVSAFTQIIFMTGSLDLGVNKLLTTSSALSMVGLSALTTVLTSSNADGTIDSNGFFLSLQEMDVANTGSNTRAIRHTGAGSVFFIGATVIQDDIELATFGSVTIEDSQLEGLVNFTAANVFSSATFRTVNFVIGTAISAIVFDTVATLGRLEIDNALYAGQSGGHLLELENPDEIAQATIRNSPLGIIGEVLQCTPVSSSDFTPVSSNTRGACVDADGNLITTDITTGDIVRYVGLTSTVDVTISAPSSNVQGVTWYKGDLYSADIGGAVRQHDGFSTTILATVNVTEAPIDLTFAGADLCTIANSGSLITIKEGFSNTNKSTYSIGTFQAGLTFDGINLLVLHDAVVSVMVGITSTIQYEFETPINFSTAIDVHDTGFMIADNNQIDLINHPVTFDQSSRTWEMSDNSGAAAPADSSDRGGSNFDNGNTYLPVTVVQNVFTDIADAGGDIFYALFSENEKCFLDNEENGELEWTSARTRGQIITGTVNVARTGATDRQLELVVVINDEVQDDSKASVFLTNTSPVTLTTLPVSKTLGFNDKVKLQFKDLSSANGEEFALAKVSIV